jgi:chromosome segregation ATPase
MTSGRRNGETLHRTMRVCPEPRRAKSWERSPVQPTTAALHLQKGMATAERREAQIGGNLDSLRKENDELRASSARAQQNRAQLMTSLNQSQEQISLFRAETAQLKAVVAAMEGSKSRLFRQAWLPLKRAVGKRSE